VVAGLVAVPAQAATVGQNVATFTPPQEITAGPDGNLWFTESGDAVGT
jgi:streptogramin lyase